MSFDVDTIEPPKKKKKKYKRVYKKGFRRKSVQILK